MKTVMIRDDVYKKLAEIKVNKSFSDIIEELLMESKLRRNIKLQKYFGVISREEVEKFEIEIKNVREEFDADLSRKFGSN